MSSLSRFSGSSGSLAVAKEGAALDEAADEDDAEEGEQEDKDEEEDEGSGSQTQSKGLCDGVAAAAAAKDAVSGRILSKTESPP